MIGDAARRLGQTGSEREREWLQEIEDENASNVVVWYASSSVPHYATDGIISRHGEGHRPTLLAIAGRPDADIVGAVFERLGLNLDVAPVVIIGGQPIHATEEVMHHLRASGELAAKLESIGWRR
jgi:hypothetical protein